jgi:hypothetical protein
MFGFDRRAHDSVAWSSPRAVVIARDHRRIHSPKFLLIGAVGTVGGLGHQFGFTDHECFVTANLDRAGGLGL